MSRGVSSSQRFFVQTSSTPSYQWPLSHRRLASHMVVADYGCFDKATGRLRRACVVGAVPAWPGRPHQGYGWRA